MSRITVNHILSIGLLRSADIVRRERSTGTFKFSVFKRCKPLPKHIRVSSSDKHTAHNGRDTRSRVICRYSSSVAEPGCFQTITTPERSHLGIVFTTSKRKFHVTKYGRASSDHNASRYSTASGCHLSYSEHVPGVGMCNREGKV